MPGRFVVFAGPLKVNASYHEIIKNEIYKMASNKRKITSRILEFVMFLISKSANKKISTATGIFLGFESIKNTMAKI